MAGGMRGEVRGSQDLQSRLRAVGQEIATKVTQQALEAGAAVIKTAVEEVTPRKSGELASGLTSAVIVAPSGQAGEARVGFGHQDYKARWLEFGHRLVKGKGAKAHEIGRVSAHPFMRPAYETSKDEAQAAVATTIRTETQAVNK
jgi:HK97 gp10 family phage protein